MPSIRQARVRLATRNATRLRAALRASVDVTDIVDRFLRDATPNMTAQEARNWALVHVTPDSEKLRNALRQTRVEGWLLGQRAALAEIGGQRIRKEISRRQIVEALATDWANWTPGSPEAAALLQNPGAFGVLLDSLGIDVQGITRTTLDRIGTALAEGLARGSSSSTISRALETLVGDPVRAMTMANTEMARAMSIASMNSYQEAGITEVEWLTAWDQACDDCQENGDAGPVSTGEAFPSGDTEPPAHPNCLCSIAPVAAGDIQLSASITKGVPGPLEVARALSRLEILPNPTTEDGVDEKAVESPWRTLPVPTVDPNLWDDAEVKVVRLDSLIGTDPFLWRDKVRDRIKAMGQAKTEFRSYALVLERDGLRYILDGHHRLMALWLLGQEEAPVWFVSEAAAFEL